MSTRISPGISRRMSPAANNGARNGRASPGSLRASRSAPTLQSQLDMMEKSGGLRSQAIGSLAQSMGAKMSSTLHHRGEHEVGAIVDPNDKHVYVPRAMWTSSYDFPMTAKNAEWDKQQFVADELKRMAGEERKKEYYRQTVDDQLALRSKMRSSMNDEKKDLQKLLTADCGRHEQDQKRIIGEKAQKQQSVKENLDQQTQDLARRAYERRLCEAQEAAEQKMRIVQTLCEEFAHQGNRRKQAQKEYQKYAAVSEARRIAQRAQRDRDNEEERRLIHESQQSEDNRMSAQQMRVAAGQAHLERCEKMYNRTAGKAERERDAAEVARLDRDEQKHYLRTDAYYHQRDRARERQRQDMIAGLDRQLAARKNRNTMDNVNKEAERAAIEESTKRSMNAEMAKAANKKAEEVQLQQELRAMMLEKEQREAQHGYARPASISTMKRSLRRDGEVDLSSSVDAARHLSKPMGRAEGVPLDASPSTIRRLTKDRSYKGDVPVSSVLGGVVGTLGGGGGPMQSALMATGGPMRPRSGSQPASYDRNWTDGLRPEEIAAGRRAARARESAAFAANKD
jgi:hypothetical protein